jgi:hypothetical protein
LDQALNKKKKSQTFLNSDNSALWIFMEFLVWHRKMPEAELASKRRKMCCE